MTVDPFDKFISYWSGIESLNLPLKESLKASDLLDVCPNCNKELPLRPQLSGIREFFVTKIEDGRLLFNNLRRIRGQIVHGGASLEDIENKVVEYTPKERTILLEMIHYFLQVPLPKDYPMNAVSNAIPFSFVLGSTLNAKDVKDSYLADGTEPHFEITHKVLSTQKERDSKFTAQITTEFKAQCGKGTSFDVFSLGALGEGSATLKIDNVEKKR